MHLVVAAVALLLAGVVTQSAVGQIVAGTEVLSNTGTPDGWTTVLYINEEYPFEVGNGGAVLTYTNFWAARPGGLYTPFVAEPLVDSPVSGSDYIVRAVGTTRVGGEDFGCAGEFRFPFHDSATFAIQDGWVAGFLSADPLSESADAGSPIPFAGAGINGWLTGTDAPGTGAPIIEVGQNIVEGNSGTDADAYGLREYQFNVSAVAGDTKPALDPGGRVGGACPPPPVPDESRIGAPLPLTDGTPDGWSGIPVLYGFQLPPGESVDVVRYYAAEARALDVEDGYYHVTPLIVKQEDGSVEDGEGIFSVWEVGPNHTPSESGEQEFTWGSSPIPDDGNLYHPAVLQWQESLNDSNGGVVAFGEAGDGMHYFNVDTTDYVPDEDIGEVEPGLELTGLETHSSAFGGRAYQLNFEMSSAGGEPGDFNRDGVLDALDVDDLTQQSAGMTNPTDYDLNDDQLVNEGDVKVWIKDLFNSWVGDANLDGEFSSGDLVVVLSSGTYEADVDAVWSTGDFNGDGRANTADLVAALADGGYELGPRQAVAAVPEPSGLVLVVLGLCTSHVFRRRRSCRS